MNAEVCGCSDADPGIAKRSIRRAKVVLSLVEESHFIVSIRCCGSCGRQYVVMFGERVDWVDSDDPQTWVGVEVNEEEVGRLVAARETAELNDDMLRAMIAGERRMVYHDMPKGCGEVLIRCAGALIVPSHD